MIERSSPVRRRHAAAPTVPARARHTPSIVQTELEVGSVDDPLEREADAVAAQVLRRLTADDTERDTDGETERAADPRTPADGATGRIRRAADDTDRAGGHGLAGGPASPEVARRVERSSGGGRPLDADVRTRMERGFGADLSNVRIHTDGEADRISRSLQARAFTTGSDIYFSSGAYRPGDRAGQTLLAHELTHTLQQGSSRVQRSAVPAADISDDRQQAVRRWDLGRGVDISNARRIRTIPTGQAVFMLDDGSGEEIVVKAEDYPMGLMKLATLVHQSVHDVEIVDSHPLDGSEKQKLLAKIADPTATSDPSWAALGATPRWAKWNQSGLAPEQHARQMHAEQIGPLPLSAQAFASGRDAKAQVEDTSRTGFRTLAQSPKYMRQLGAAAAADLFLGNADRISAGVTNLGNWMVEAGERVQLIDNMDENAKISFDKNDIANGLFPPDMRAWGSNPEQYYVNAIDRLLQEARDKGGDADIVTWANGEGGFIRRFMIEDFRTGFHETIDKVVRLYGKDKKSKAGRATKEQIKGLDQGDDLVDYWEVLKARARFLRNPKKAKSLAATVAKRQKKLDKKRR
ncbi:MAG: DUF4157 domain-containing protein [Ilumatobacteraceae bacterium]